MTRTEYVMRLIGPLDHLVSWNGAAAPIWPASFHAAGLHGHPRLQTREDQRLQRRPEDADFASTHFAGGGPAEPGGAGGARSMMRQP